MRARAQTCGSAGRDRDRDRSGDSGLPFPPSSFRKERRVAQGHDGLGLDALGRQVGRSDIISCFGQSERVGWWDGGSEMGFFRGRRGIEHRARTRTRGRTKLRQRPSPTGAIYTTRRRSWMKHNTIRGRDSSFSALVFACLQATRSGQDFLHVLHMHIVG